jgi:hypothetical protein
MPSCLRLTAAASAALVLAPIAAAQTEISKPSTPQPVVASAPAYSAPRTSFGHPSFEGVWTTNFILPIEASPNTPLVLPEEGAKKMVAAILNGMKNVPSLKLDPEIVPLMESSDGLARVKGERRTRAIVQPADGKMPLTPEARAELMKGQGLGGMDNPEERPNWERCVALFGQPPVAGVSESNPRFFVQTPGHVIVHTEYGDEVRIVPFAGEHRPAMFHGALGDSIARWEGETLVIETIGLPTKDRVRLFPALIVPATSKVIERYTRISNDELLYQYTIEDPTVYTAPWLAEFSLYRTDQRMFESHCQAGNYSLPNIMRAQRIKDEKAAKKN